jgi:hypothetical protein
MQIMKIVCGNDHKKADDYQEHKGTKAMTDVVLARSLVQDIGGPGRVNEVIYAAYKRLSKMFPHAQDHHNRWSEHRLRNWWYGRSTSVQHFQMVELYQAASKAKEERALLAAARREHAQFIAKTARIAALLEHQDEAFHSAQIAALRGQTRDLDRARDSGDR